jgi:hypothetical protein
MPVAQPRQDRADQPVSPAASAAGAVSIHEAAKPAAARIVDDLAVPAPSPVHRLQADLAQLTTVGDVRADDTYPGWLRLGFPLAASLLLWAAILRGSGLFG